MANILVSIEKGIEVGAEDALKWLADAQKATPQAVAALGVLIGAADKVITDGQQDAVDPVNIVLNPGQIADLKAVWPAVKQFAGTLGIKL